MEELNELETSLDEAGTIDIFAVVHVENSGNGTVFPKAINSYLTQGYHVHAVDIPEQANGAKAIAFVTLRKR